MEPALAQPVRSSRGEWSVHRDRGYPRRTGHTGSRPGRRTRLPRYLRIRQLQREINDGRHVRELWNPGSMRCCATARGVDIATMCQNDNVRWRSEEGAVDELEARLTLLTSELESIQASIRALDTILFRLGAGALPRPSQSPVLA